MLAGVFGGAPDTLAGLRQVGAGNAPAGSQLLASASIAQGVIAATSYVLTWDPFQFEEYWIEGLGIANQVTAYAMYVKFSHDLGATFFPPGISSGIASSGTGTPSGNPAFGSVGQLGTGAPANGNGTTNFVLRLLGCRGAAQGGPTRTVCHYQVANAYIASSLYYETGAAEITAVGAPINAVRFTLQDVGPFMGQPTTFRVYGVGALT
jgi:hypothetical protein